MRRQEIFFKNINAVYGAAGKQWLEELPALLDSLSAQWDFHLLHPLPNLTYSFVAIVEFNHNADTAILKIAPHGGTLSGEIRWLQTFKPHVPEVFQTDEKHNAFLMEHLTPGTALKQWLPNNSDEAACRVISETIGYLHAEKKPADHFKTVVDLGDDIQVLQGLVSKHLVSKAQGLFQELSADKTTHTLLHGDLHHDNILQSGSDWKVIDPHGYYGDACAEIGPMIFNPLGAFPADRPLKKIIERRLKILTEMLPYDARRIPAWAFCWALLSAAWDVMGQSPVPEQRVAIARIIEELFHL